MALALSLEALVSSLRRKVVDEQAAEQAQAAEVARQRCAEQRASQPVAVKPKPSEAKSQSKSVEPEVATEIRKLREKGLSIRAIAGETGVNRNKVDRLLKSA